MLGPGDHVAADAGAEGLRFLLAAGRPIGEPVVQHGPRNTQVPTSLSSAAMVVMLSGAGDAAKVMLVVSVLFVHAWAGLALCSGAWCAGVLQAHAACGLALARRILTAVLLLYNGALCGPALALRLSFALPGVCRRRSSRPSGTLRVDGCKIPPMMCGLLEHGYAPMLSRKYAAMPAFSTHLGEVKLDMVELVSMRRKENRFSAWAI